MMTDKQTYLAKKDPLFWGLDLGSGVELGVEGVDLLSFFLFKRDENRELSDLLGGTGAKSVMVLRKMFLVR